MTRDARGTTTHPAAILALSLILSACAVMGPQGTIEAQETAQAPQTDSQAPQEGVGQSTGETSIQAQEANERDKKMTRDVTLTINKASFKATLEDNPTTAALLGHLPQRFTMSELNGNEKYVYLDWALPANASRPKRIEAGDIMLYGSDCLVVFYESFDTPYSYTRIGKVLDTKGLKDALGTGSAKVRFELK